MLEITFDMDKSMKVENFIGKKIYFSGKKSESNKMVINNKYVSNHIALGHVSNHDVKIRIHF